MTTDVQQQSTQTFFQPDRRLLGVIYIMKRVVTAITIGSLIDNNVLVAAGFVALRELLSAATEYSVARNPISTTQQSSPPNPEAVLAPVSPNLEATPPAIPEAHAPV